MRCRSHAEFSAAGGSMARDATTESHAERLFNHTVFMSRWTMGDDSVPHLCAWLHRA